MFYIYMWIFLDFLPPGKLQAFQCGAGDMSEFSFFWGCEEGTAASFFVKCNTLQTKDWIVVHEKDKTIILLSINEWKP